jgi:MoaA/NifB/PqqE/SkfB family radical SAM enzyme
MHITPPSTPPNPLLLEKRPVMSEPIGSSSSDSPLEEQLSPILGQGSLPVAYRLPVGTVRRPIAPALPRVVFIEVTNRCNLSCQTCVRTYFTREPLKTLSYDEFVTIADQFPAMRRVALHGIGEPLLNRDLPRMIRYLKERDVEVLFNSNGTLLTPKWQEELVRSGLDEFRCSIDGARPETYARIRGTDLLHRIVEGLTGLIATRARLNMEAPRISIWCVATTENLAELPTLVQLAAKIGVPEVYVQRMTFFAQKPDEQYGMARQEYAIFGRNDDHQEEIIAHCAALGAELGIALKASGAKERRIGPVGNPADLTPWQACVRLWTTAYVTANGNCLPCCISPFATSDYQSIILGNLFERPFVALWNDTLYRKFRTDFLSLHPHKACASCGVYWSL